MSGRIEFFRTVFTDCVILQATGLFRSTKQHGGTVSSSSTTSVLKRLTRLVRLRVSSAQTRLACNVFYI